MKNLLQNFLKRFGFELHRTDGKATMAGALHFLAQQGFKPAYVIDGGASNGRWTRMARRYFPDAHYTLVEMQPQFAPELALIPNATVVSGALGPVSLDSLLKDPARTFLKLDLDGAEPPVLAASSQLSRIPAVLMECPFPQLPEKCALMAQKGFSVSRICDLNYGANGSMTQVDILFVSKELHP